MEPMKIAATERSPEIDFDFAANVFSLRGESYPEDVTQFYGPIMEKLDAHLSGLSDGEVEFNFELIYFNSSTAKTLMNLFDLLDSTAASGNKVVVNWFFDADDENMEELGEEFGEDLENAEFHLQKTGS